MSRTKKRYQHKKTEKNAQDLMAFFSQALYQRTPKLRRAMSLEELDEEIAYTSDYFVSWLETNNRQAAVKSGNPRTPGFSNPSRGASTPLGDSPAERAYFWEQMRLMADLGTGVWRMRQEINHSTIGETRESFRLANRFLTGVWDRLIEGGLSIRDYTGQREEADSSFFLIPQEPDELSEEQIFETIKPAIYYQNNQRSWQIQVGHAIDRRTGDNPATHALIHQTRQNQE